MEPTLDITGIKWVSNGEQDQDGKVWFTTIDRTTGQPVPDPSITVYKKRCGCNCNCQ